MRGQRIKKVAAATFSNIALTGRSFMYGSFFLQKSTKIAAHVDDFRLEVGGLTSPPTPPMFFLTICHINQEGSPSWFIYETIQHFPLLAEPIQIVQAKLTHSRFMIPRISMMRASMFQHESVIRRAAGYAR